MRPYIRGVYPLEKRQKRRRVPALAGRFQFTRRAGSTGQTVLDGRVIAEVNLLSDEETVAFLAVPGNLERVQAGEDDLRSGDMVPAATVLAALAARRDGGDRPGR